MSWIIFLILVILCIIIYNSYKNKDIPINISEEDIFIEELAKINKFYHPFLETDFILKPVTEEEIEKVKELCNKYHYDYYELFKHFKKPFFTGRYKNINMYYLTGTLTLKKG